MVSDQDLARGVETLLRQSDPTSLTSLTSVVHQLEAKLGLDLSDKTNFIRDHINLLLRSPHQPLLPHQPHTLRLSIYSSCIPASMFRRKGISLFTLGLNNTLFNISLSSVLLLTTLMTSISSSRIHLTCRRRRSTISDKDPLLVNPLKHGSIFRVRFR